MPRAGLSPDRVVAEASRVADEVGLDRLTLAEVAGGAHDPSELWPATSGAPGRVLQAAGALVGTPATGLFLLASAAGSAVLLRQEWRVSSGLERGLTAGVLLVSLGAAAVLLSPLGWALSAWALD